MLKAPMRIYKIVMSLTDLTSLPVQKSTREELRKYGQKGDTWDAIINKLMSKEKRESLSGPAAKQCQQATVESLEGNPT